MATQRSSSRSHPTACRSDGARVELDLAENIFCLADCHQMLRLLSLRIRFPFFPSFTISCGFAPRVIVFNFVAFRRFSFFRFEQVIDFTFPSLSRSSLWSAGLVSDAEAGVSFCCLLCPSFIWWRCNPHCQNAISFFCVFRSNMGFGQLSSFQPLQLCFFSCIQSILLQFLLCQVHHPYHS